MSTPEGAPRRHPRHTPLDHAVTATLQRSPAERGWTSVCTDRSAASSGTRGLVEVTGTVDGHPFRGLVHLLERPGPARRA